MKIRLATTEIQRDSIVDGEGVRCVIWTQGCIHHCPGCHNPETHSFQEGFLIDTDEIKKEIKKLEGQDGITFSGGDPMEQADACAELAEYCKQLGLNVWCYTGYTFEELLQKSEHFPSIKKFLEKIDILVDGRFILAEKSYDVTFRGSKNQRIINVSESLKKNKAILESKYDVTYENQKGRKSHYMFL